MIARPSSITDTSHADDVTGVNIERTISCRDNVALASSAGSGDCGASPGSGCNTAFEAAGTGTEAGQGGAGAGRDAESPAAGGGCCGAAGRFVAAFNVRGVAGAVAGGVGSADGLMWELGMMKEEEEKIGEATVQSAVAIQVPGTRSERQYPLTSARAGAAEKAARIRTERRMVF